MAAKKVNESSLDLYADADGENCHNWQKEKTWQLSFVHLDGVMGNKRDYKKQTNATRFRPGCGWNYKRGSTAGTSKLD